MGIERVERREEQVIGGILPAHPDLAAIISKMREKYPALRDVMPEGGDLTDTILSDAEVDWEAIRNDVEAEVRRAPELIPEHLMTFYLALKDQEEEPREVRGRVDIPGDIREAYVKAYQMIRGLFKPVEATIDKYLDITVDRVMEFLMTNRSRAIPAGWLGTVYVSPVMGSNTVVAMAGPMVNHKEIAAEFRRKCTETFGRSKPNITDENLNTVEFLTLKLNGMRLKDIADIYIQRHPSEFPTDPLSKEYKAAKRKLEDRLKMRIIRLQDAVSRLGDG